MQDRLHPDERAARPARAGPRRRRPPSRPASTSRSSATTTSRGSTSRATRRYAWAVLGAVAQATERVAADDLRDLPDHALPPGRGRPEGGDRRSCCRRRPLHPRARRGREPQRARRRPRLAAGERAPRDARRGGRDHQRAVRRRVRQPRRRALPGRLGEALGPARAAGCRSRVAVSGSQSVRAFAAESPTRWSPSSRSAELVRGVRRRRRAVQPPKIGQQPICWGPTATPPSTARTTQFRWFGGGWKVNAELPGPGRVRRRHASSCGPEDVAEAIPCGPDVERARRGGPRVRRRRVHPRRARADRRTRPRPSSSTSPREELLPALRERGLAD